MVGELPTLFRVCMFVWEVEERKGGGGSEVVVGQEMGCIGNVGSVEAII